MDRTDSTDGPLRDGVSQGAPGQVVELAVNLDDVSPQVLGDAQERLLEAGALDVWTIALGMKKQRPGVMLCVLCAFSDRAAFAHQILELTGSFGVRYRSWQRLILDRRYETVATPLGTVRLKIGSHQGRVVVVRPEYEDVRKLAQSSGKPLRAVMEAAQAAAHEWQRDEDGGYSP